ncbi:MAG: hypothetical protein NVSMB1_16290 [Polyangiales bacterium]
MFRASPDGDANDVSPLLGVATETSARKRKDLKKAGGLELNGGGCSYVAGRNPDACPSFRACAHNISDITYRAIGALRELDFEVAQVALEGPIKPLVKPLMVWVIRNTEGRSEDHGCSDLKGRSSAAVFGRT